MDMCIGFYMHRGVPSIKAKYDRKLTRCVEVMYPPHVESMFHTPLCTRGNQTGASYSIDLSHQIRRHY